MNRQLPVHFRASTKIFYLLIIVVVAVATVGVILLLKKRYPAQRRGEAACISRGGSD